MWGFLIPGVPMAIAGAFGMFIFIGLPIMELIAKPNLEEPNSGSFKWGVLSIASTALGSWLWYMGA